MTTSAQTPEQLTLLATPEVPVRFRLDEATRRRGLQHIAEIRALLEERSTAHTPSRRTTTAPPTVPSSARVPRRAA